MKLPVRGFRKPLDTKWLVRIPLYTSGVFAAFALAATLRAKDWEPLSWQGLLAALSVLVILDFFVLAPLLVVEQLLGEKKESHGE